MADGNYYIHHYGNNFKICGMGVKIDISMIKDKSFVVIGGGTGTFCVLSGLKKYTDKITAIVTMADSGGSAKKEKDEWGLLPSSDIRKSLIALADISSQDSLMLRKLFSYRYNQGRGIKGMSFGNLFLVALTKILGSQKDAIEKASQFLRIKGRVLPVSFENVDLVAEYEDGSVITGEHFIDEPIHNGKLRVSKLYTDPSACITKEAQEEIENCDAIIIGPGGFYTTILANLVIKGVVRSITKSKAKKIFIMNMMTEYGQTYGFTASTFISELNKYLPVDLLDYVLINSSPVPEKILKQYIKYHAQPIVNDLIDKYPFKVLEKDLISKKVIKREKGDSLKRSLIRHDSEKVVSACIKHLYPSYSGLHPERLQ